MKEKGLTKDRKDFWREYFSIPNLMGYFRIVLAVFYVIVCIRAGSTAEYHLAAGIIAVSMVTDFLDGQVARRFHMVTDWGKILDPVSDKITLGAVALGFILRYPLAEKVAILFLLKEGFMAVAGMVLLRRGWKTEGALFCGKVCTASMYGISVVLLLFPDLMPGVVNLLLLVELVIMAGTLAAYLELYWCAFLRLGRGEPPEQLSLKEIQRERKEKRRKWKRLIPVLAVGFLVYLVAGAVIPFAEQPELGDGADVFSQAAESHVNGEESEPGDGLTDSFDAADCYGDGKGVDRARILADNGEALDVRIQMIRHARERVILSTFDFRTDEAGLDMAAVLLDAADRGVKVEIFADGFNSWLRMEGNPYFYALSSHPGITITIYNKLNLLKPWNSMGRMHDKYVIVDDTAYLLGGRNTFGYFLGDYGGHINYDWDVLVYHGAAENTDSEVENSVEPGQERMDIQRKTDLTDQEQESSLYQVLAYYEKITSQSCCSVFHDKETLADKLSVRRAAGELRARLKALQDAKPELFSGEYDYAGKTEPTSKVTLLSNPVHVNAKEPVVFYELMELAQAAREQVTIHTPYIMCNDAMYEELTKLGGKAALMLNSAANNGNPFAAVDYLRHKQELIDTGVQLLEYESGVSYHGKVMTVDDDLAVVGSFNMDMRSAYIDTELMLVINSRPVTESLKQEMAKYEADAAVVETVDTYREIPEDMELQEISWKKKALKNGFGWLLERLRFLL